MTAMKLLARRSLVSLSVTTPSGRLQRPWIDRSTVRVGVEALYRFHMRVIDKVLQRS